MKPIVAPQMVRGKLRTTEIATGKVAVNAAGTPLDGGGWKPTRAGMGKAERQAGYINDAHHRSERKKHGRI